MNDWHNTTICTGANWKSSKPMYCTKTQHNHRNCLSCNCKRTENWNSGSKQGSWEQCTNKTVCTAWPSKTSVEASGPAAFGRFREEWGRRNAGQIANDMQVSKLSALLKHRSQHSKHNQTDIDYNSYHKCWNPCQSKCKTGDKTASDCGAWSLNYDPPEIPTNSQCKGIWGRNEFSSMHV